MLRKKWLSLLVAISMVAAMFPSTVFATSEPAESAGPAEPASQTSTEVPEDDTLVTEGNETPDVVTDEDTDTDETDQSTDETVINTEENTEGETPAEGTQPAETTEENKVEETKPEQPTVPETTPAETPNTTDVPSNGALGISLMSEDPDAGEAREVRTHEVADSEAFKVLVAGNELQDGDKIVLTGSTYDVGALTIRKGVEIYGKGVDTTIINGSITFDQITTNAKVKDLTLKAVDSKSNQAICVKGGTNGKLEISNCKFVDFMYGVGVNSGSTNYKVQASNLQLENVWCAVGICTGSPYNNHLYSFDISGTYTYAAQAFTSGNAETPYNSYYNTVDGFNADAANNYANPDASGLTNPSAWPAVAKIGDNYYGTLEDAVGAATNGTDENPVTITLTDDVELDKMLTITTGNVVLDLGGHEITASDTFTWQEGNQNACHLVQIGNDGEETSNVTIRNGTLKATGGNKNTLNVYKASNVTLGDGLKVDHASGVKGAPLVINASDVTLTGDVEFVTGAKSWYSVNVDSKGEAASLNFAENTNVTLGESAIGIQVDGSTTENMVTLAFDSNVNVTGSTYPVLFNNTNTESVTVTGIENSNLKDTAIPGAVAIVNGKYYTDLQAAVNAIADSGEAGTVELVGDVDLTAPVEVPKGMNLTVIGNDHTIKLPTSGFYSAFNNVKTGNEGLKAGTVLNVENVNFVGSINDGINYGHAVVVGFEGDVDVTLSNCKFKNMHDAVYCNAVTSDDKDLLSNITIKNGFFDHVDYAYGWDNGVNGGEQTGQHNFDVTFATGSEQPGVESFAEAEVNGKGYPTLEAAIAAAQSGETVKLLKDVTLDKTLEIRKSDFVLDLGSNTISADDDFSGNLIQLTDDAKSRVSNVKIMNGTLEGGSKHTLNVWNAEGVILEDLTLDNTKTSGGAPLVVGGSDVTLEGSVAFKTNDKSWYGANVDTVDNGPTGSSLTVNGTVTFDGPSRDNVGIYVENSENDDRKDVNVSFGENSAVKANNVKDGFVVLKYKEDEDGDPVGTVTNPENAGLITDANGNYVPKPAPAPSKPSTGSSHEHSYVWQGSPDEHWQYCTECGQVVSNGAHTFQWKDGVQVCSVCGYKVTQTSSTSTAPAGSTTAAAAAPAAGTTATAATGIPQTSDNSNPMLWVVLLALSGSALGGMTIYKKKKEN